MPPCAPASARGEGRVTAVAMVVGGCHVRWELRQDGQVVREIRCVHHPTSFRHRRCKCMLVAAGPTVRSVQLRLVKVVKNGLESFHHVWRLCVMLRRRQLGKHGVPVSVCIYLSQ